MGNCMSAEAAEANAAPAPPRPAGNATAGAGSGAGKQQAPNSTRAKQYYEDDQSKAIIESLAGAYKVLRLLGSGELTVGLCCCMHTCASAKTCSKSMQREASYTAQHWATWQQQDSCP